MSVIGVRAVGCRGLGQRVWSSQKTSVISTYLTANSAQVVTVAMFSFPE
jgi:hypothetical protein